MIVSYKGNNGVFGKGKAKAAGTMIQNKASSNTQKADILKAKWGLKK